MKKMLATLLSLGLLGAMLGGSSVAQAATSACTFSGSTTSLVPPVQIGPNKGTFSFTGPISCTGAISGNSTITASGTYDNTVCGTGTATGTANFGGHNATFTIQFAAGQGAFINSTVDGSTATGTVSIRPSTTQAAGEHGIAGTGAGGNNTTDCVNAFDVNGSIAVA